MPNKYKYRQGGKLVGGQHKLDEDNDGDIDGDDFKILRGKNSSKMRYGGRICRSALKRAMKKKKKK